MKQIAKLKKKLNNQNYDIFYRKNKNKIFNCIVIQKQSNILNFLSFQIMYDV